MILGASVAVPGGCAGQEEAEHSAVARLRLAARPMLVDSGTVSSEFRQHCDSCEDHAHTNDQGRRVLPEGARAG